MHVMRTQSYLVGSEVYPGQHTEMLSLASAVGCDINEHVPTLIEYGKKVKRITEMGVRFGWSTRCFLFTQPDVLFSIDKFSWGSIEQAGGNPQSHNFYYHKYKELYKDVVKNFQFLNADTTKIPPIPETDLLFIDTFHHRDCLSEELELHGNQSERFIIMHDTETFGQKGQADASLTFMDHVCTDEPGTGLWHAINPWLRKNPHWGIKKHYTNNNGLTILERR